MDILLFFSNSDKAIFPKKKLNSFSYTKKKSAKLKPKSFFLLSSVKGGEGPRLVFIAFAGARR